MANLHEGCAGIEWPPKPSLHQLYGNGVKVECSTGNGRETIYTQIIDFQNPDNNDLPIVNQFSVAGTKQVRRPDVVVFVNGLPLAAVELKNPANVRKAYSQLQTYKDERGIHESPRLTNRVSPEGTAGRVAPRAFRSSSFTQPRVCTRGYSMPSRWD